MSENSGLSVDERAELERLRSENAALRAQAGRGGAADQDTVRLPSGRSAARQRWRTVVATLLIVVACVLAPLSVVAVWTRNQVTNTDRYVATVSPLASDPAIQNAIADQITAQVFTYIDIRGLTTQAAEALAQRGNLPPRLADQLQAFAVPIANGVQSFTRDQVGKVVASDAFTNAWIQANRTAHAELVKALTGEGGGAVTVENDTVSVNLAAFVQTVKAQLVASGFTLAERIPEVNASFVLFQSKDITRVRSGFNLLNTLGVWLPIIMLILLVVGVYVAKDHRRALVGAAVGVAVSMVVLALALAIFRSIYLDAVPANLLPHDAAAVLYDTIVRFLRLGLRTILVLALVVAAGAFLSGQSVTAVRTREGLGRAIGWLQGGAEQAGFSTGPVGAWVYERKRALRIGAVTLAALVLVFWGRPTGKVVLGLTVALLVVLALIEFLGRRPGPAAPVEAAPAAPLSAPPPPGSR
jgi:transposase InsO family protein